MTAMRFIPVILAFGIAGCQQSGSTTFSDVTNPLAPAAVDVKTEEPTTIRVISGDLLVEAPQYGGALNLKGIAGFTFSSHVSMSGGMFDPYHQCTANLKCFPGTAVSLRGTWIDSDLPSRFTLRGTSYRTGLGPRDAVAYVEFNGSVSLPPFTEAQMVEVSAPFTFKGAVTYFPASSSTGVKELLTGHGVARLTFQEHHEAGTTFWMFTRAVYEFHASNRP